MEYRSETNRPKQHEFAQGNFNKYINKYEDIINKNTGKLETKITDKEDFYEKIQSYKDTQTLESIIKRYEIDIDKKQIKEINDDIVDMSLIPTTMTEAYSMIKQVENEFDQRPAEIKRAFNNNVGEYVAGIQNGRLKEVVEAYKSKNNKVKTNTITEEVKQTIIPTKTINQEQISKMVQEQIEKTINGGNNV